MQDDLKVKSGEGETFANTLADERKKMARGKQNDLIITE